MTLTKITPPELARGVSTAVFASNNHVQPQTPRKQYCLTGSYFGVVPEKLASGRLVWPNVIVTTRGAIAANDATVAIKDGAQ
ncbi:hypothetical protein [Variovorax boronicumulans]